MALLIEILNNNFFLFCYYCDSTSVMTLLFFNRMMKGRSSCACVRLCSFFIFLFYMILLHYFFVFIIRATFSSQIFIFIVYVCLRTGAESCNIILFCLYVYGSGLFVKNLLEKWNKPIWKNKLKVCRIFFLSHFEFHLSFCSMI